MTFITNRPWLLVWTACYLLGGTPLQANDQALAEINGTGGDLDAGNKMAPGAIQLHNKTAFALVLDNNKKIAAAGGTIGDGRVIAFSHGSFLKQTAEGGNADLLQWVHRSLRWLGGADSDPITIGIQDEPILTAAQASLVEAGFDVEVFPPSLLLEHEVDVYCVVGHDATLGNGDVDALTFFADQGGGVAVFATPWPFGKKFPNFVEDFPGNQIVARAGIEYLPQGMASARPFHRIPSALDPSQQPTPTGEKSDLDELLERTYPMPKFKPLEELVDNWQAVPDTAIPSKITVHIALDYGSTTNARNQEKRTAKAGHQTQPLKFKPGSILVGIGDLRAVVGIDDTDFKEQVALLYERGIAQARARTLAQREQMKREVSELGKMATTADAPAGPITRTALTSTVAANYGKGYRGDYMPEIKNGKNLSDHHEIALGPIGGKAAVYYNKKEARILELWDKGPGAKSGLKEGDLIVKVGNQSLKTYGPKSEDGPTGAPEQLGMAMIDAQATGRPLELTVIRNDQEELIKVELPALPPFDDNYPANCQRSAALTEGAAQWLADNQKDDGMWRSNHYSSAWCGLALLATGDPKYKRQIRKAARAFAEEYEFRGTPSRSELINAGQDARSNWKVCMVGIFLGEYLLATGDDAVTKALMHCCQRMEARLHSENGRLGHSTDQLPYSEKGLVIINVHAHLMWALAARVQDLEWDWAPWELSYQAVDVSISKDFGVGYNFSAKGGAQCGSRTGAMVTAQILAEQDTSTAKKLSGWLKENHHQFPNTHAMTSLGLLYGVTGLKNASDSGYRKCMDDYRWLFSLVQPANLDHGSYYFGQRANTGGDGYCNYRLVGNYVTTVLLSSHRNDTLWMFGNRIKDWYQ